MNPNLMNLIETTNSNLLSCEKKDFSNCIALAQLNPTSADIKSNAIKAIKFIKDLEAFKTDAIIFPELFLVGNPIGDFSSKFPILIEDNSDWLNLIAKNTNKTKVIIGFIDKEDNKNYNALAILSNGKIEKIVRKFVLSNKQEVNESRIFEAGIQDFSSRIIDINSQKYLLIISIEEVKYFVPENLDFDAIIIADSSISRVGKEQYRYSQIKKLIEKSQKPVLYINQVGSNDCFSFDGASSLYNSNSDIVFKAKSFEENICLLSKDDIFNQSNLSQATIKLPSTPDCFSLDYEFDLERIYKSVVQSIRDYFRKTGFKRAVLGLSGGLDSTVSAVLLVDALGPENVFGISMPSKITSNESKNDAQQLAENLGMHFIEFSIKDICEQTNKNFSHIFSDVESKWNCRYKESFTSDNIQARSRAMILWGVANEFESCLPIATSDKSELYMGYATINGDMSGGFAPLADITKTKLFALARWMNEHRKNKNTIPQSIIDKRPGAELAINPKTGKPLLAEEALMPYEFLDEIIWNIENKGSNIDDLIKTKFLYETNNLISQEQKMEWLKKFFRRMSTSLYKSVIMPPYPIIDTYSINKVEYFQPIVSVNANYNKTSSIEKLTLSNDKV